MFCLQISVLERWSQLVIFTENDELVHVSGISSCILLMHTEIMGTGTDVERSRGPRSD